MYCEALTLQDQSAADKPLLVHLPAYPVRAAIISYKRGRPGQTSLNIYRAVLNPPAQAEGVPDVQPGELQSTPQQVYFLPGPSCLPSRCVKITGREGRIRVCHWLTEALKLLIEGGPDTWHQMQRDEGTNHYQTGPCFVWSKHLSFDRNDH